MKSSATVRFYFLRRTYSFLTAFVMSCSFIILFSFDHKISHRKFMTMYIYYRDGTCNQKIPFAFGQFDCRDNGLDEASFKMPTNRQTSPNSSKRAGGDFIAELVYDITDYSTRSSALNDVWSYYFNNANSLPPDGFDVVTGTKHITIYRATAK